MNKSFSEVMSRFAKLTRKSLFMKVFASSDFRNIVILVLTTLLIMAFFGQIPSTANFSTLPDQSWYLHTAETAPQLDPNSRQPFAFRLLGPYVIGLLPIAEPLGFRISTIVLGFCFVFLSYYTLRYIGLSSLTALISAVLMTLNRYIFGWTFWGFFFVNDFLMMIFIMVMFLAMWQSRWLVFSVALALGAMTREPTMVMVPVALFYVWEKKEPGIKWRKVLLACTPGLITILLIRLFVPIGEGTPLTEALATYSSKLVEPRSLFRLFINTFLPFSLIPLIYFRTTLEFFKSRKYLLVFIFLIFCTTLFGSNQERLMIPAGIIFFMLLGTILENANPKRAIFFVLIVAGCVSSIHYNFGNWQVPDANWTRALTLGSSLVVSLFMIFIRWKSRARLTSAKTDSSDALRQR